MTICRFLPQHLSFYLLVPLLIPSKRKQEHHSVHYQVHFNHKLFMARCTYSFVCRGQMQHMMDWEI